MSLFHMQVFLFKCMLFNIVPKSGFRWVRTRWALLVLFWLGWVGMLAGAIVIIVQAPRCKPIPEMNWWNEGPLYQISDLNTFSEEGGLQGSVFMGFNFFCSVHMDLNSFCSQDKIAQSIQVCS